MISSADGGSLAPARHDVKNSVDGGSFLLRAPCDVKEEESGGL